MLSCEIFCCILPLLVTLPDDNDDKDDEDYDDNMYDNEDHDDDNDGRDPFPKS